MWELKTDIFNLFDRKCAVLTSGDMDDFIAMPISWGTLGMLWERPVLVVFMKPSGKAYEFFDWESHFTVSFYKEEFKEKIEAIDYDTGCNEEKMGELGFYPVEACESVTFSDAEVSFLCKKIFHQRLDKKLAGTIESVFNLGKQECEMIIGEIIVQFRHQKNKDEIL